MRRHFRAVLFFPYVGERVHSKRSDSCRAESPAPPTGKLLIMRYHIFRFLTNLNIGVITGHSLSRCVLFVLYEEFSLSL